MKITSMAVSTVVKLYAQQELYGERLRELKTANRPTRQSRGDRISISQQAASFAAAGKGSSAEITYGNMNVSNGIMRTSRIIAPAMPEAVAG